MKKLLITLFVLMFGLSYAQPPKDSQKCKNQEIKSECECDLLAYLSGSFLFLQPIQEGVEFAKQSSLDTSATGSEVNYDFKFKPGLKVGAGIYLPYDKWTLNAQYTWFHPTLSDKKDISNASADKILIPHFGSYVNIYHFAKVADAKWKLLLDMGELSMSRPFFIRDYWQTKPSIGLKGGRLDQKIDVNYSGTINHSISGVDLDYTMTEVANWKSKSWFAGPFLAFNTKWLKDGFYISNKISGGIYFQDFKVSSYMNNTTTATDLSFDANTSYKFYFISPQVDINLGIGWESCIADTYYVDFSAEYDFFYFWNQNLIRHIADQSTVSGTDYSLETSYTCIGNLMLQGLTLRAKFAF